MSASGGRQRGFIAYIQAASQDLQGSSPASALGRALTVWTDQCKQRKSFIREVVEIVQDYRIQYRALQRYAVQQVEVKKKMLY